MSTIEATIEELKNLPPMQQDEAARFIHSLKAIRSSQRRAAIEKTFGCLSEEEASNWEVAVHECRRVDHESW